MTMPLTKEELFALEAHFEKAASAFVQNISFGLKATLGKKDADDVGEKGDKDDGCAGRLRHDGGVVLEEVPAVTPEKGGETIGCAGRLRHDGGKGGGETVGCAGRLRHDGGEGEKKKNGYKGGWRA